MKSGLIFQIKCKIDLPVGQNLQDHVVSVVGPFIVNETVSFVADRDISRESMNEYRENGTGKNFIIMEHTITVFSIFQMRYGIYYIPNSNAF
jgi:hypothetical protein